MTWAVTTGQLGRKPTYREQVEAGWETQFYFYLKVRHAFWIKALGGSIAVNEAQSAPKQGTLGFLTGYGHSKVLTNRRARGAIPREAASMDVDKVDELASALLYACGSSVDTACAALKRVAEYDQTMLVLDAVFLSGYKVVCRECAKQAPSLADRPNRPIAVHKPPRMLYRTDQSYQQAVDRVKHCVNCGNKVPEGKPADLFQP